MGKGRDYRGPRRRGFDDDMFQMQDAPLIRPSRPFNAGPIADGPPVDATVKWFNAEKGFGFVELADGSGDAFLHIAVLQSAGHQAVAPGTKLKIQVGQGQKGRQVTSVLELDASTATATAAPPRGGRAPGGPRFRPDPSTATDVSGTVKWFNPEKGFGFVTAEDGGKDVFVHISVLERSGLKTLAEGERVAMRVVQGQKGREALSVNTAA